MCIALGINIVLKNQIILVRIDLILIQIYFIRTKKISWLKIRIEFAVTLRSFLGKRRLICVILKTVLFKSCWVHKNWRVVLLSSDPARPKAKSFFVNFLSILVTTAKLWLSEFVFIGIIVLLLLIVFLILIWERYTSKEIFLVNLEGLFLMQGLESSPVNFHPTF